MGKTLLEAIVKKTKKCRHPSKYYVYVLEVSWSEGTSTIIYRRYSDFFEFQCGLLERFPEEAGFKDPSARIIPFLPGKKLLGRSQVRSVAERRKDKLNDYCKALVRLPPKISDDEFVHNFFEVRSEDLQDPVSKVAKEKAVKTPSSGEVEEISGPIVLERYVSVADYEKQKKNECSLTAGQMVEVVDKNQNGWWFVSLDNFNEGWVPATYLEPLYGMEEAQVEVFAPGQEQCVTSSGYHAQNPDELSFEKGVIVDVCTKGVDGWWKIRYKDREGLAPAVYLNRYTGPQTSGASPAQLVDSVRDAVQLASGTKISSARIDVQEPIYAPTPRKMAVKRQIQRPAPVASSMTTSVSSSTTEPRDEPVPVYEEIPEREEEVYMTIADFQSSNAGDGLNFSTGSSVTVVTKNPSGWWYVEMGDKEGWVPSSYLERAGKRVATPVKSVAAEQPAKSSPVQRKQLPQSSKKTAAIRRSTSEEALMSQQNKSKTSPHSSRVNSPPVNKSLWLTNSTSHPHLSAGRKPTIAVTPSANKTMSTSQERGLAGRKHAPVIRSSSSENPAKSKPHLPPSTQHSLKNLNVPKSHVRSHSASSRDGQPRQNLRERADTSQVENKQISELTKILQKKQAVASPVRSQSKISTPQTGSKTPSPSTTRRLDLTKKQQPQRSKPIGGSATAKRTPPKRPEPPKINTAKKAAPPRPSTSPGQTRKLSSSYSVVCDYSGGEGQLSLQKGQSVEVLEKNSDGWWYMKMGAREGWAPSSFLEEGKAKPERPTNGPSRPNPVQPELSKPSPTLRPVPKPRRSQKAPSSNTYRAAASYQVPAYEDSGIDLVMGETYEVLDKADGWWFITDGQREGWAPSSYLDPA